MAKLIHIILWVFTLPPALSAQESAAGQKTLSQEEFLSIVRQYHPVMQQARIGVDMAKASLLMARGGFDPVFYFNNNQKTFDGKNYYHYINPEIKIPTWYGVEVKAGTENNNGLNTNTELSPGNSSYLGITVPLAKNLLIDKRRAALKQAKVMVGLSEAERRQVINDLVYEAGTAYWNWVRSYLVKQVADEMVTVSRERFSLVKTGFRQGDRPALDTTEALAQLQQFEYIQSDALVGYQVSGMELSNYLWKEGAAWYQLDTLTIPELSAISPNVHDSTLLSLPDLLAQASINHPALKIYEQKIQFLKIEKKLKFQELLPKLDVSATLLNQGYDVFNKIGGNFYENNNKFGITLGVPLRFSEGRGGYKIAGLKVRETSLEMETKKQAITNKLTAYFKELTGLEKQIDTYEQATANYEKLARGENIRFQAGEGTLFLVNARETKLLEARQKMAELKTKYQKSRLAVQWAAGVLK